nr:ParB N-terminal domain-containing protein [Ferrovum sp.]
MKSPTVEMRRVDSLIPYARNARTHSEEQVQQIASSIREFGFTNPVLIDWDGGVIAGHGRILAARQLGMTEVPTITLDGLSEVQKRAYIIFGGSGSTLIACEKTGREARLMELDPKYVDVIVKRWQEFTGQHATLEADGRTFSEVSNGSKTT